jgi:hypothetical protein
MKTFKWSLHLMLLMVLSSCGLLPKSAEQQRIENESIKEKQSRTEAMAEKILDQILLIFVLCFLVLPSCTSKPKMKAVIMVDPVTGMKVTTMVPDLGGSLMTKKDIEVAKWKGQNGEEMVYFAMNNDETVVPVKVSGDITKVSLGKQAVDAFKATPGVDKGTALIKGTKDPNFIPKDPNLPTTQIVPEGSVVVPR